MLNTVRYDVINRRLGKIVETFSLPSIPNKKHRKGSFIYSYTFTFRMAEDNQELVDEASQVAW